MRPLHPVDHLFDLGYRGIAYVLTHEHESQHGSMEEVEEYEVVARGRDGVPKRLSYRTVADRYRPMRRSVHDETDLDEATYAAEAARLGGARDTSAWQADRERRRTRLARIDEELRSLAPTCPDCGIPLELKSRRADGHAFFGCPNYRRSGCRQTRTVTSAVQRRIRALNEERAIL